MSQSRSRAPLDANAFRRIVLGHEGAVEGEHMGHPDFRLNGRIFATIAPGGMRGMVRVTLEEQARLVTEHPQTFTPENGAWGRQGCTRVAFGGVDEEVVGEAVTLAWQLASRLPPPKTRARKRR